MPRQPHRLLRPLHRPRDVAPLVALPGVRCDRIGLRTCRFTAAALTDAAAGRILADATTALRTNDGPGDIACNVVPVQNGKVTAFAAGSLDSSAECNTVIGLAGEAKGVNQINWCGSGVRTGAALAVSHVAVTPPPLRGAAWPAHPLAGGPPDCPPCRPV